MRDANMTSLEASKANKQPGCLVTGTSTTPPTSPARGTPQQQQGCPHTFPTAATYHVYRSPCGQPHALLEPVLTASCAPPPTSQAHAHGRQQATHSTQHALPDTSSCNQNINKLSCRRVVSRQDVVYNHAWQNNGGCAPPTPEQQSNDTHTHPDN